MFRTIDYEMSLRPVGTIFHLGAGAQGLVAGKLMDQKPILGGGDGGVHEDHPSGNFDPL